MAQPTQSALQIESLLEQFESMLEQFHDKRAEPTLRWLRSLRAARAHNLGLNGNGHRPVRNGRRP